MLSKVVFYGCSLVILGQLDQKATNSFLHVKPWKKYAIEIFFGFLGLSRDRKSVIEIAQIDQKPVFSRITVEPVITGKKILPLQIWLKFKCK
jgi:hypothetical protein